MFFRRKTNLTNEMDFILRDLEAVLDITSYYTEKGHWAKNSRKRHIVPLGAIDTRDNIIRILGKWYNQREIDHLGMNAAHIEKNGCTYLYFRTKNELYVIYNKDILEVIQPSIDLSHMTVFLSYVTNLATK